MGRTFDDLPELPPADDPEGADGGGAALVGGDAASAAAAALTENIADSESELNADSYIVQPRSEEGAASGKRPLEVEATAASVSVPKRSRQTSVAKIGTMLLGEHFSDYYNRQLFALF